MFLLSYEYKNKNNNSNNNNNKRCYIQMIPRSFRYLKFLNEKKKNLETIYLFQ